MTPVHVPEEPELLVSEPLGPEAENPQERRIRELEEQVRLFRLLNQINREIGSTLDLSGVLASACQLLGTTINCSRVSILVKDSELHEYLITRGEYVKEEEYKRQLGLAVPLGDNPHLKIVMSQSGPVATSRFLELPGLGEETKELAKSLSIQSMLAIATRYQGQVNGVIGVQQCDREREWTAWERELLEGVASQLGIAINQAQIYTAARAAAEREAFLRSVARQISSTLDLNTILQTAVKGGRELLDTDRMLVYQFKENWLGEIVVEDAIAPWSSLLGQAIGDNCFSAEHAQMYQQGRVRAIDDVRHSGLDSCHVEFLESLQVKANLIVPIAIGSGESGSQLWGLLIAQECRAKRIWKNEEIEWLRQIADEMAIAVNQAQLYHETRAAAERESLLRLVTDRIRSSLECSEILQTAVSGARQLLQSDRVLIYQFRENWHGSVVVEETIPPWNSILGEEVADRCFSEEYVQMYQSGRVRPINDIREAGLDPEHFQFLERLQVRANLIVPILIGKKLWGLLIAHECNGPRSWQPEESQLLRQLAEQLAIAIQQAELFEQVQDSAAKYQAQARELQATLEELRSTQVQLIQSVKLSSLGQMVAGIAHEINNANNFIRPNLFYTRDYTLVMLEALSHYAEAVPEPPDEIAELNEELDYINEDFPKLVKSMQEGSDRIRSIVETLRNFAHLDEAESKAVDLNEGLESSLAMVQHRLTRQIVLHKEYGELPLLECRPGQINQVFYNLLQNALDAIEEKIEESRSTGELTIRTWLGKMRLEAERVESLGESQGAGQAGAADKLSDATSLDAVVISIRDRGVGIAPETKERIFDPFFTTKEPGKGTGLGLSLCYQVVVKGHGGRIDCISQPGQGAEFLVQLPLNSGN